MSTATPFPILINGAWCASADPTGTFQATNPATGELLPGVYPVSGPQDVQAILSAAVAAKAAMRGLDAEVRAQFLDAYAANLEAAKDALVAAANAETGLPVEPRLGSVELPRTVNQLRLAAKAVRARSFARPTIDTATGIRCQQEALDGAVLVFGPNNFPFAFNAIAGGDFAAAIAAGCPVIAKVHTSHPTTSRLLAECAVAAATATGLPAGAIQLVYRIAPQLGFAMVESPAVASVGFTGGRDTGMRLKDVADRHGKPVYLEMSSVNPVFVLPGVLAERGDALADEFSGSCIMGAGQFCTNPGFVVLPAGTAGDAFTAAVVAKFTAATPGVLLGKGGRDAISDSIKTLTAAGATVLCGGKPVAEPGYRFENTILTVSAATFLENPEALQTEAFGPVSLFVIADDTAQMAAVAASLEGNLTGTIYSAVSGSDDAAYDAIAPVLRGKVGRLLNDKMPTGVAVSPAMNHGGPFPATGHPYFTSVGLPAGIERFTMRCSYDNVRAHRLPAELQDGNPLGIWRSVDGGYTNA